MYRDYRYWFAVFCLCAPAWAFALESDRQQPVVVEADRVQIDELNHVSTYSGQVMFQQGTLVIRADEVVVKTRERRIAEIVATGSPAHFRQRPEGANEDVTGRAEKVTYDGEQRVVTLLGNAEFKQGNNAFSGPRMVYDIAQDTLQAYADKEKEERVKVIIQPEYITDGL